MALSVSLAVEWNRLYNLNTLFLTLNLDLDTYLLPRASRNKVRQATDVSRSTPYFSTATHGCIIFFIVHTPQDHPGHANAKINNQRGDRVD